MNILLITEKLMKMRADAIELENMVDVDSDSAFFPHIFFLKGEIEGLMGSLLMEGLDAGWVTMDKNTEVANV